MEHRKGYVGQYPLDCGQEVEQVWFSGVHCDVGGIELRDRRYTSVTLVP
jgi:hypothetical protein